MGFSQCILSVSRFLELSLVFESDEKKLRYLNLNILAWKLKGHNRSAQKYKNRFFLISFLWLIELIGTEGIGFGLVEIILLTFKDMPSTSDKGR